MPAMKILMTRIHVCMLMTIFTVRSLKKYGVVKLNVRKIIPNIVSIIESLYFYK